MRREDENALGSLPQSVPSMHTENETFQAVPEATRLS